jgi:hypothetical protein
LLINIYTCMWRYSINAEVNLNLIKLNTYSNFSVFVDEGTNNEKNTI